MIYLCGHQYGTCAGGPQLDLSVLEVRVVPALLARRLIELFLDIGIRFGFGSYCIRLAMAGPVIAIAFRGRRKACLLRGSILLLIW